MDEDNFKAALRTIVSAFCDDASVVSAGVFVESGPGAVCLMFCGRVVFDSLSVDCCVLFARFW
jgi:hypothetical protein